MPLVLRISVIIALAASIIVVATRQPASANLSAAQIVQVGVTQNGAAQDDEFGTRVAVSNDGSVVAVSAPRPSANPATPGYVSVFTETSGSWVGLGNSPLEGLNNGDFFGASLALSANGQTVAVGAPGDTSATGRVTVWSLNTGTNEWGALGVALTGGGTNRQFGSAVALDDSGTILAVGARNETVSDKNFAGTVQVYSLVAGSWTPLGARIDGAKRDSFGTSVSLSANGLTLAVGAPGHNSGAENAGRTTVFSYNAGTQVWDPLGDPLDGLVANEASGSSVALSKDATTLVMGSPAYSDADAGSEAGAVRSFGLVNNTWTPRGVALVGTTPGDKLGSSVSVSGSGDRVITGGVAGPVWVLDYQDLQLVGSQTPFTGFVLGNSAGSSVAMNLAGTRFAIGAPLASNLAAQAGSVGMYAVLSETPGSVATATPSLAGIGLHHAGSVGRPSAGATVYFGADRVMPESPLTLTLRHHQSGSQKTVLMDTSTSTRGTVYGRYVLPGLATGDYTLVLSGLHASGTGLMLTQRFSVGPTGDITALGVNLPGIW